MTTLVMADARREILRCAISPTWFTHNYCMIYDPTGDWLPFHLWAAQASALRMVAENRLVIWLKARQLGMTWLALAYALNKMIFTPGATVLLFSRRDDEASDLLKRLRGMYERLPCWLQSHVETGNAHHMELSNRSVAKAFPTTAGDSYSATLALVDEADLVPDLDRLLGSVKPTIDAGGQLVLLSRVDKSKPQSPFKRIYRAAREGQNAFRPLFLPWNARPDRTPEWYAEQRRDSMARTGSLDSLYEQYPATPEEALAPKELDKRIAPSWLRQCYVDLQPLEANHLPKDCPAIPGLIVYRTPEEGNRYVIGADPAEGNPTSDESALAILDAASGEEVARLSGRIEPTVLAGYIESIGGFYNNASAMVERNNHGHAVLAGLKGSKIRILRGHDRNHGWLSSAKGKVMLYDATADAFRDREVIVHSFSAFMQLSSIEGGTLRAPEGEHDDQADAHALATAGMPQANRSGWKLETI